MNKVTVRDYMNPYVYSIAPETSLPDAHSIMKENRIRRLPVMQDGELIGIVTINDIYDAEPSEATTLSIWELNYRLARLKAHEFMTPDPLTVTEGAGLAEAARLMCERKIGGLPVTDRAGKVVGIITESDIFRWVVENWAK